VDALKNGWTNALRFGFRLLYNEMAFTYDTVSEVVSLGQWRCWQRAALAYMPQPDVGRVLELAHGTGNMQLDLHERGYQALGYDLSAHMGRITQRKMQQNAVPASLVQGMAQQLPFADGTFAAVLSTFPTDFIVAPQTLQEVWRVLQSDGPLVIVPNGVLTGGGMVKGTLEWLYRITGQREGSATFDIAGYFTGYGFVTQVHDVECPNSKAQVVVATKQAE
jgi:ubiquinone/menaquinone biosynthesis C-methylase UbiE